MAQGRCAGCGGTGSVKAVQRHIMGCAAYARLYQEDKARALSPEEEYARWQAGGKQAASTERREQAIDRNAHTRLRQARRFARLPDILEDE